MTINNIFEELDKLNKEIKSLNFKDFEDLRYAIKEYEELINKLDDHEDLDDESHDKLNYHGEELKYFTNPV